MLLGAYGFAITVRFGGPFWLAVLVAIVAATLFALILGLPTLKLRGDYLAIVTIAAAEIIRIVGGNQQLAPITGGVAGIGNQVVQHRVHGAVAVPAGRLVRAGAVPVPAHARATAGSSGIVCWARAGRSCSLVVFLLMRSPWGRTIRGIREDEDAVRSLGKNVYLVQDAVADPRRRHRRARRRAVRAAAPPCSPTRSAAARRSCCTRSCCWAARRPCSGRCSDRCCTSSSIIGLQDVVGAVRPGGDHVPGADPAVRLDRRRRRPDAAGDLPTAGHPGEQEGAELR